MKDDAFKLEMMGGKHLVNEYLKEGAAIITEVPFLGFFELVLGGMCGVAISGQGAELPKFAATAMSISPTASFHKMVFAEVPSPGTKRNTRTSPGGENAVRKIVGSPLGQFYLQAALLHYAAENAMGTWEFKLDAEDWTYPGAYIRKWSPQRLGRSLLTQLCQNEYLVE